jgi:hypothetical protein
MTDQTADDLPFVAETSGGAAPVNGQSKGGSSANLVKVFR